ncbi:Purple acid phosphatase [Rhynchospora pubera]|uniref:Purple acid phosphatase n=1 Tax=Rhynchospora pubera TaxID=906938 RepID=A0AAV8FXM6_9POAL|nr:Purple acid phosphatase [Rhynchospora pubera]
MEFSKPHFLLSLVSFSSLIFSLAIASPEYHYDDYRKHHPEVSEFRLINRRELTDCLDPNPYLYIRTNMTSTLPNEAYVTVTVGGVLVPDSSDWIGMISPSNSSVDACPGSSANYIQTGDVSSLPLLCHYPVKAQYVSNDPSYLSCSKQECVAQIGGICLQYACIGTVTFHVINIRTDITFVFFTGGFALPCVLRQTNPIKFTNPSAPLYGHVSSIDSTGTSMRLTWVSGDNTPQQVQYASGKTATSTVKTFTTADMCSSSGIPSPAKDFGWHHPGYIHSAIMTGLLPCTTYSYKYGSASVGWSSTLSFKTPPASGATNLTFAVYGDMGKAPLDQSVEHYIQPGSTSVTSAITRDLDARHIDSVFHIGDISYATGFLVEWEFFLKQIEPYASRVPCMAAIGNHERDYPGSGSVYSLTDSGGECGVPYETYFQMPVSAKDKPWYSIEQGPVHFTVVSTENTWTSGSEQYNWIAADLASVNRKTTPWVVFAGHRQMYSSSSDPDSTFTDTMEPLLLKYKVDLALFGHVHNYERSCAVYQQQCKGMPTKDASGIDTYNNNNYTAPIQVVVGMAGFSLDSFPSTFVNSGTSAVHDRFRIIKQIPRRELKGKESTASEETELQIQRILHKINSFTHQVSEILEAGKALFKDLTTDFEERLISIHREQEEIKEIRAHDSANEAAGSLLRNAQFHLFQNVHEDS